MTNRDLEQIEQIFIPFPFHLINEPSKVPGYEKFNAMTELGHKIFKGFELAHLYPLFSIDPEDTKIFNGIIIHVSKSKKK